MEKVKGNQANQTKACTKKKLFLAVTPVCGAPRGLERAGTSCKFIFWGKKNLLYFLSPPFLNLSSSPFPCSPRPVVPLCFYRWLYWLSQLFQETRPGGALLFSSPLSLVEVTFLQAHMVRQHVLGTEGTWGRALPSCRWAHLDLR